MQTNSTTTKSAAQTAAIVANAVKNEAAKRFGAEAAAKLVVGTINTPQAAPQAKPEAAEEKNKRTRKTAAPKEEAKPEATAATQQEAKPETAEQRAARMQKELQTTLQKLTKLQDLNKKRTKFIETLDLLTDAKQKLTAEEDFEAKSYKIDFCGGTEYRADKLFSIANRELLLDFVDYMQSKIQERVGTLEAEIIEV
ncbi:MAG: hypothetical protein U0L68_06410 [Prevotellamassilia sp.]|nr:hypothetical protein [Prevotellamassilia sp.]